MEPLTWTGPLGSLLNPALQTVTLVFMIAIAAQIIGTMVLPKARGFNSNGEVRNHFTTRIINLAVRYALFAFITLLVLYLGIGAVLGASSLGIIGGISRQLLPIWISMIMIFTASIIFKRKLGLFGKLFDSPIGLVLICRITGI
jgi:peptide/nickel transport system permease protein